MYKCKCVSLQNVGHVFHISYTYNLLAMGDTITQGEDSQCEGKYEFVFNNHMYNICVRKLKRAHNKAK